MMHEIFDLINHYRAGTESLRNIEVNITAVDFLVSCLGKMVLNILMHWGSVHVDMKCKVFKRRCKSCHNLVCGRNTTSSTSLLKCDGQSKRVSVVSLYKAPPNCSSKYKNITETCIYKFLVIVCIQKGTRTLYEADKTTIYIIQVTSLSLTGATTIHNRHRGNTYVIYISVG